MPPSCAPASRPSHVSPHRSPSPPPTPSPPQEIFSKGEEAGNITLDRHGPYAPIASVIEGDVFKSIGRFPVGVGCAGAWGLRGPGSSRHMNAAPKRGQAVHVRPPRARAWRGPHSPPRPSLALPPKCRHPYSPFALRFVNMALAKRPPALYMDGRWSLSSYLTVSRWGPCSGRREAEKCGTPAHTSFRGRRRGTPAQPRTCCARSSRPRPGPVCAHAAGGLVQLHLLRRVAAHIMVRYGTWMGKGGASTERWPSAHHPARPPLLAVCSSVQCQLCPSI